MTLVSVANLVIVKVVVGTVVARNLGAEVDPNPESSNLQPWVSGLLQLLLPLDMQINNAKRINLKTDVVVRGIEEMMLLTMMTL